MREKNSQHSLTEAMTLQYLESVFTGEFCADASLSKAIIESQSLPMEGDHLVSPRMLGAYTHHGIYIGNRQVIHYSGLADGLEGGPIEITSLNNFENGQTYSVKFHENVNFTRSEIVEKAKERLGECSYNVSTNNCEHFVNQCIYGVSHSKQISHVTRLGAAMAGRVVPHALIGSSIAEFSSYVKAYLKGDITKEKLFQEAKESAIPLGTMAFYGSFGQAAIPVPIVGALIGAGVGYFVGNMLAASSLIALGESDAVKYAKSRRVEIERICDLQRGNVIQARINLEKLLNDYFEVRSNELSLAFDGLDEALVNWDSNRFIGSLNRINSQFGATLSLKSFEEFDDDMMSDAAFEL